MLTFYIYFKVSSVFKLPRVTRFKERRKWIELKYTRNYLVRDLDCVSRAEMLCYHYKFLNNNMSDDFLDAILNDRVVLWKSKQSIYKFEIILNFPRFDREGDLSLEFAFNGMTLYNMSFTIVPGNYIGISHKSVLLITRSQGSRDRFRFIKFATKSLNDISPLSILLTAAQSIATALGLKTAAVSAKFQIVAGWENDGHDYIARYDETWISMGGEKTNDMVFELPAKPGGKPLSLTSRSHRSRTKKKRQYKIELYNHVLDTFGQQRLHQDPPFFNCGLGGSR